MMRFPDKPAIELGRRGLSKLPSGLIAQAKMDGWRCVVEFIDSPGVRTTYISRHKKSIPITGRVAMQIEEALAGLPTGTILDGEWLGRRPGQRDESLWLFDIMQLGDGVPLWQQSTLERWRILESVVPEWLRVPTDTSGAYAALAGLPWDYTAFFDEIQSHPIYGQLCEGIVLKAATAKYIGSVRQCALNPGWMKSKWRIGESGQTLVEHSRSRLSNA